MLRTIALVVIVAAFGSGVANAQQKVEVKGQSSKVKLNQVVSGYLSELNGKYQLRVSETTFEPGGSVAATSSCRAWYSLHYSWGTHVHRRRQDDDLQSRRLLL